MACISLGPTSENEGRDCLARYGRPATATCWQNVVTRPGKGKQRRVYIRQGIATTRTRACARRFRVFTCRSWKQQRNALERPPRHSTGGASKWRHHPNRRAKSHLSRRRNFRQRGAALLYRNAV